MNAITFSTDYGRPDLKEHFVAKRNASAAGWDNDQPDIARARLNYELGTHTLVNMRFGNSIILYAIPLKVRDPKPRYFRLEYADPRSGR
jgi:hypothetical protein